MSELELEHVQTRLAEGYALLLVPFRTGVIVALADLGRLAGGELGALGLSELAPRVLS